MALRLYPLEVCLPQLARSLDSVKAAKARIALLQVFSSSCGAAVTTAAALPGLRSVHVLPPPALKLKPVSGPPQLKPTQPYRISSS